MQYGPFRALGQRPSREYLSLVALVEIFAILATIIRIAGVYGVDQHELVVGLDEEIPRRERGYYCRDRNTGGRPLPDRDLDDPGLGERPEVQRYERDLPRSRDDIAHDGPRKREKRHATPSQTRRRSQPIAEHEPAEGVDQRPRNERTEKEIQGMEAREHHRVDPGEEQDAKNRPLHCEPPPGLSIRAAAASSPRTRRGWGQRPIVRMSNAKAPLSARSVHGLVFLSRSLP